MSYLNEDLEDKKIGWKRVVNQPEKKGLSITVRERKTDGKIKLIRSDSKLLGCNVFQYEAFMKDFENWSSEKSIKEIKLILETENRMVIYMEMAMPLMKNRTAVLDIDIVRLEGGSQVLMMS